MLEGNEDFNLIILAESLPNDIRLGDHNRSTVTIVDDDSKSLVSLYSVYSVYMAIPVFFFMIVTLQKNRCL